MRQFLQSQEPLPQHGLSRLGSPCCFQCQASLTHVIVDVYNRCCIQIGFNNLLSLDSFVKYFCLSYLLSIFIKHLSPFALVRWLTRESCRMCGHKTLSNFTPHAWAMILWSSTLEVNVTSSPSSLNSTSSRYCLGNIWVAVFTNPVKCIPFFLQATAVVTLARRQNLHL